jgi:hypothetical protein
MPDHDALRALLQDRKESTKAKGGRAQRRMAICLDAALSDDLEDADRELAAAKEELAAAESAAPARAGGKVAVDPALTKRVKDAEKAVEVAEKAADAASVFITFKALRHDVYDEVLKANPPREGNEFDALADHNRDTFPDALMKASALKQVEDVDGKPVAMDVEDLIAEMSSGERNVACRTAELVNGRESSFSDANSHSRQRSGSNSKRR